MSKTKTASMFTSPALNTPTINTPPAVEEKRKIHRSRNACVACHKARSRCDNGRPCSRCVRMGISNHCSTFVGKKRGRKPNKIESPVQEFPKQSSDSGSETFFGIDFLNGGSFEEYPTTTKFDSDFPIAFDRSASSASSPSFRENSIHSSEFDALVPLSPDSQDSDKSYEGAIQKYIADDPVFYLSHSGENSVRISSTNQPFLDFMGEPLSAIEGSKMSDHIPKSFVKTCFTNFLTAYLNARNQGSQIFSFTTNAMIKTKYGIYPVQFQNTVGEVDEKIVYHKVQLKVLSLDEGREFGLPIDEIAQDEEMMEQSGAIVPYECFSESLAPTLESC